MKNKNNGLIFSGEEEKRKISDEIKDLCKHKSKNEDITFFDFIENKSLKKRLEKSFKEIIYVDTLIKTLDIQYTDAHPFNEIQIIHYAGICEAILNYSFDKNEYLKKIKKDLKKNKKDNVKVRLSELMNLEIINDGLKKDISDLWDLRNNVHLMEKEDKEKKKFCKKDTKAKTEMIKNFCKSIKEYLRSPVS